MEGTYEILGVIGRSGLGTLYRARYQGTGAFTKLVTLKRLDEGVADTDEVACRLRDEARMLGFLDHRAIVRVDNLVRLEGRWTLVLEHVDGVSLEAIIERGALPIGPALEVVATVAGALHAAYTTQGPDGSPLRLQHRDVKPSAVLIDAYGDPRVTDFGIARACFTGREARTRSFVVGSFEYMAPERLALEEGGPWSDIYSLGQVFYALLSGHNFGRSHPSERHHKAIIAKAMDRLLSRPGGVDEGALELLGRMLALEPHERPDARSVERSCHQLVRGLEDETLRSWAEQTVEPMIAARNASSQGGLVGRFLSEGEAPAPAPPRTSVPDPSLVAAHEPAPRSAARRELEPIPLHTFTASRDEDDATEIMKRPSAGGASLLDDEEADSDATEMFSVPKRARPEAPTGARPPVSSVQELYESVTSMDLSESASAAIDLSAPDDEAPVFRRDPSASPQPSPSDGPPTEEAQSWSDVADLAPEPSEDFDRPTTIQEPDDDEDYELDLVRPTVIQEPDDFPEEPSQDPAMLGRPTAVSWFADEVHSEIPQQGKGEVTAVTPSEVSDGLFPPFALPAGLLDEQTAIGPDLETARAARPELAQVRFDLPAAAQDDRTLESDEGGLLHEERDQAPQVRFDMPAGHMDEHTALGEDIEAARSERDGPAAMPRVHFDADPTAAAAQAPMPPALAMPAGPPPPPAEPLAPARPPYASASSAPQAPQPALLPPLPSEPPPPAPPVEPPAAFESALSGPPAPPPPPPSAGGEVEDRPTSSQARSWAPGAERHTSADRPQLDHWEPPSFSSIVEPVNGDPPLDLSAMPDPVVPPAVQVQVEDELAAVDVQVEAEPAAVPSPRPAAPAPMPTQGQDATVARRSEAEIAPGVPAPPPVPVAAKPPARKGKLLLVLGALVLLGVVVVGLVATLGIAWYFLYFQ
mgnify:CR=1 FL=1